MRKSYSKIRKSRQAKNRSSQKRPVMGIQTLGVILKNYPELDREYLLEHGMLTNPPSKGNGMILPTHRTEKGEQLLAVTKDNLISLLYDNKIPKHNKDLATIVIDEEKADAFNFIKDAIKWTSASDSFGNPKVMIEIEYFDSSNNLISKGIIQSINAINELEINDPNMRVRTERIEDSNIVLKPR